MIVTLQITKNNESFGDLYFLEHQIFGRKNKWLDLKLKEDLNISNDKKGERVKRMDE